MLYSTTHINAKRAAGNSSSKSVQAIKNMTRNRTMEVILTKLGRVCAASRRACEWVLSLNECVLSTTRRASCIALCCGIRCIDVIFSCNWFPQYGVFLCFGSSTYRDGIYTQDYIDKCGCIIKNDTCRSISYIVAHYRKIKDKTQHWMVKLIKITSLKQCNHSI